MDVRRIARWSIAPLALVTLLAACGDDDSSSATSAAGATTTAASTTTSKASTTAGGATTSAATGSAAICAARADLKTSVEALKSIDVVKNGTAGITTALGQVKTDLVAVKSAASADLQPQVTALENAIKQLETAISDMGSKGVGGVVTAGTAAYSAGTALVQSLDALKCS